MADDADAVQVQRTEAGEVEVGRVHDVERARLWDEHVEDVDIVDQVLGERRVDAPVPGIVGVGFGNFVVYECAAIEWKICAQGLEAPRHFCIEVNECLDAPDA